MASPELAALLCGLAGHAPGLSRTESLEEYQRHAREVCGACALTPAQLAGVRGGLAALDGAAWAALADEGAAVADAVKCGARAAAPALLRARTAPRPRRAERAAAAARRTLNALMRYGSTAQACTAAALFSWMLRAPDAPVHVLLDTLTFSGCMQRVKESVFAVAAGGKARGAKAGQASQRGAAQADGDDDGEGSEEDEAPAPARGAAGSAADVELALCLCHETLTNLAAMASQTPLRGSQEVLQAGLEGGTDLAASPKAAKPPGGSKSLGLSAGSISAAAYALLDALFSPRHGDMQAMAAVLLPRLTPLMAGAALPGGKRSAAEAGAARAAAVAFVRGAYGRHPEIEAAVAALARHVCLRAPDKADSRAAAIRACTELAADLPQGEQEQFVGFVFSLSRTNKLGLRTLSVGLANALLMNLPEPFKRSTFAAAAAAGAAAAGHGDDDAAPARAAAPAPPAGMAVAPWSVVALAALLQRCSDKSAVVRGRALSDLAEVVDCFASLLAQEPGSEQHQVAEAFVEGLCAAAALQLPQPKAAAAAAAAPQRRKPRRAGRGDDDGSDGDDGDEAYSPGAARRGRGGSAGADEPAGDGGSPRAAEAAAEAGGEDEEPACAQRPRARQGAAFVAFVPSQLSADLGPVTALVHRRCGDAKAAVRRGGLQLLEALLIMRGSWAGYPRQLPGSADLSLLEAATADPLVSVRKAALVALSTLVELFPGEPSLAAAWVSSALPLVRDVEATVQDALADWAAALLLDKAAAVGGAAAKATKRGAAPAASEAGDGMDWQPEGGGGGAGGDDDGDAASAELRALLAAVAGVGRAAGACLGKLCAGLAAKRKLKAGPVCRGLEAVIAGTPTGSASALGAYALLKEVAAQDVAAPSWRFLQQRWAAVRDSAAAAAQHGAAGDVAGSAAAVAGLADEAAAVLLVITQTAAGFPADQAQALAAELLQHTLSFQLPPAAAGAHVAALFKLTEAASGAATGTPAQWARQVYAAAHECLRRYIDVRSAPGLAGAGDAALDHATCAAVFTAGEVALLRVAKPPGGLTVLLQALTGHRFIPSAPPSGAPGGSQQPGDGDGAGGAAPAGGRPVPGAVQAHAWTALGKVCLVDEGLAKKVVPLFVQELGRSPLPVVRNNIMVALSDMLIQYTALVDAHMPRLAACIRDRHELVRRQALALLANLLMKDYVKWRGPLFHRFLLALVDPSPAVRALAEYLLRDTLATKAPLLAYNHFVEALFVLNGCTAGLHGARLGAHIGPAGGGGSGGAGDDDAGDGGGSGGDGEAWLAATAQFTLKGRANRPARDVIYASLLRSMSPEHKFSSAAKLAGEVLAGVADGLLPLAEAEEVLRDALVLMASKDIKVSASRLAATDDDELPAPGGGPGGPGAGSATAAEAAARARGKLVSALMKRHLVEQVVPVLVELRRLLAEAKHPLLGELMGCFAALLRDYKGEVEDILVADKQLAKEILYDIKQAELAKTQMAAAAAAAHAAHAAGDGADGGAPAARSPPPAGVVPGTPVAAEVLATAERERRERLAHAAAAAAGGGDGGAAGAGTPAPPGGGGVLRTPASAGTAARSRLAGAGTAGRAPPGVFKTPAPKVPGSTAGASTAATGTGARSVAASPAPLTLPKGGPRVGRARGADENQAPGTGGHAAPNVSAAAAAARRAAGGSPAEATNVVLPSPYAASSPRQWNIPQHVATGEKPARGARARRGAAAGALERELAQAAAGGGGGGGGGGEAEEQRRPAAGARRGRAAGRPEAAAPDVGGDGGRRPAGRAAARREALQPTDVNEAPPPAGQKARARAARGAREAKPATVKAEPAAAEPEARRGAAAGGRKRRNA
ncbi:Ncapd3 [Scenedesmus sp. PABB004]|nr:Ncapd3 [Scenedesmus sp. PABB004]